MELLFSAGIVISITVLGAASPGPDTALLLKNSLIGSRRAAFATALGIVMGNAIYVFVALLGLGVALTNSGSTYVFIQALGALYLMYLGVKLFIAQDNQVHKNNVPEETRLTTRTAFIEGLTTNLLNPKFVLFLLAMFSQVIDPSWSVYAKLFLGILIPLSAFCVFIVFVMSLTHERTRSFVRSTRSHIERMMGAVLIGLGIKVITSIAR